MAGKSKSTAGSKNRPKAPKHYSKMLFYDRLKALQQKVAARHRGNPIVKSDAFKRKLMRIAQKSKGDLGHDLQLLQLLINTMAAKASGRAAPRPAQASKPTLFQMVDRAVALTRQRTKRRNIGVDERKGEVVVYFAHKSKRIEMKIPTTGGKITVTDTSVRPRSSAELSKRAAAELIETLEKDPNGFINHARMAAEKAL